MDVLLSKLTQHAMNYAIRSGITITTGYALNQATRLLKTVKGREHDEIAALHTRLQSKIQIISPAINMIELIAARGNTSLDSAVALTKTIRMDIQSLGTRLANAVDNEVGQSAGKDHAQDEIELRDIISDIKRLLSQIEDAVPLINLAITTSGVSMSTSLPSTVSPSRLLQASTFLSAGDSAYNMNPGSPAQVGPVFTLSLYMLFGGHAPRPDIRRAREMTWKEVVHKARVKLVRVPLDKLYDVSADQLNNDPNGRATYSIPAINLQTEYAYQLMIIEDLDDDRVHSFEDDEVKPGPFEGIALAGIREIIPIHEICKIFYADTGKILNIGADGEPNNPVLLLKRDKNAVPPRRMMERHMVEEDELSHFLDQGEDEDDGSDYDHPAAQIKRESSTMPSSPAAPKPQSVKAPAWKLPLDLDPEWMAFEVYTEEPDSDDEKTELPESSPPSRPQSQRSNSMTPVTSAFSTMHLSPSSPARTSHQDSSQLTKPHPSTSPMPASLPALRTSLSLLELLIRLTSLQQFQQTTHLSIEDELLNFFLSESSSTGAGADSERRKAVRANARRQVGFDPYAESPIKVRGEEYIHEHEHERELDGSGRRDGDGDGSYGVRMNAGSVRVMSAPVTPIAVKSKKNLVGSEYQGSPLGRNGD